MRPAVPKDTLTEVLTRSRRRCCLCFGLNEDYSEKQGQVAHLDQNRNNNAPDNLAFLCLFHHDSYDSRTSQSKGLTLAEVRYHREVLYAHTQSLISQRQVSDSAASYSRDEFEEAIVYLTGTHRSQSVVEGLRNGPQTLEEINRCLPPCDLGWTMPIIQGVIELGWVRRIPTRHYNFELTLNAKRMLEVLAQIPEPIKESAWREAWLPDSQ